jgi:hypothetical protein
VPLERRDFLKAAAVVTTAGAVTPASLLAEVAPVPANAPQRIAAAGQQQQERPPPIPLGNGEHPAIAYQAYSGGTGALCAKWDREGVNPFDRHVIDIPAWTGLVPTDEEDLAFLPVHRLSALVRDGHISSVDLTAIYLQRLKPTTLLEDLFADDTILSVAHAFQKATDWHTRRPDMDFA